MSRLKTARQRQEYLDALSASGESVRKWCEQNGMHRNTVYRWRRQEAKNKVIAAKSSIEKPETQTVGASQIKWLPVSEIRNTESTVSKNSKVQEGPGKPNEPASVEIRVQIGSFTITAPDGFKQETLTTVCQALQTIC